MSLSKGYGGAEQAVRTINATTIVGSGCERHFRVEHLVHCGTQQLTEASGVSTYIVYAVAAEIECRIIVVCAGMLNEEQGR